MRSDVNVCGSLKRTEAHTERRRIISALLQPVYIDNTHTQAQQRSELLLTQHGSGCALYTMKVPQRNSCTETPFPGIFCKTEAICARAH
jgi:hypothetical protein